MHLVLSARYSVERFYDAPLVTNITCGSGLAGTWLTFTAHNCFKQNELKPGTYEIALAPTDTDDTEADVADGDAARRRSLASGGGTSPGLSGGFKFVPHWRSTHVSVDLSDIAGAGGNFNGTLSVLDEWGDRTTKHVTCQSQV